MIRVFRGVRKAGLVCATAVLTLLPSMGYGLGLGPIKVVSALNEPLDATIEFTSINQKELQTLEVGLAPVGAFQAVGIERSPELSGLQFLVEHHPDGRPFLRVTTRDPFPEPYLHILVQAEWAGGRLRREYTALIDPPFLNASRPSGIQAPQTSESQVAGMAPSSQAESTAQMQTAETGSQSEAAPEVKIEQVPQSEMGGADTEAKTPPPPVAMAEPVPPETATTPPASTTVRTEPIAGREAPSEIAGEKPLPIGMKKGEHFGPQATVLPVNAPDWATGKRYYVKRGDTAWGIARRIRRDRKVSMEQVVLALYDANPRAFFGKNVNNLKAGKILRIPDESAVRTRSPTGAHKVFAAQYDEWQEYKLKLARSRHPVKVAAVDNRPAAAAASRPVAPHRAAKRVQRVKPAERALPIRRHAKAPTVKKVPAKKVPAQHVEARAKPAKKVPAKVATTAKAAKPRGIQLPPTRDARKAELLRIVRANLDSGQQAGKSAESETKAADKQKLNQSVASLNSTAAGKKPKGAANAKEAGKPVEKGKAGSRPIEIANPRLARVEPTTAAAKAKEAQPAPPARSTHRPLRVERHPRLHQRPLPPRPEAEEGLLATVMGMVNQIVGNQFMLMLLGGVLALTLVVSTIYVRRRRRSLTEFEESILTSGDVASSDFSMDSDDQLSAGSASDTSFLSDFSQGGLGNISTDEVDPVAEADVYLAYGRDEQAEEILKDAVVKNPDRNELKEKLLEIYAGRSDVTAFETLAEELYASLGGQGGALWDRVVEMGRKLAPDNPMFTGGAVAGVSASSARGDETMALTGATMAFDSGLDEGTPPVDTGGLEFDIGGGGDDTSLEMDMNLGGGDLAAAPASGTESEEEVGLEGIPSSNSLDFNLDMGTPSVAEPEEEEATEDATGGLEFTGLEGFGADLTASESDDDLGGGEMDLADTGGLSDSESLEFDALRQNTADNNRSGLSLSIGTDMDSLDEDSGDVAVDNEVSFEGADLSFESPSEPEPTTGTPGLSGISAEVDDASVTVGGGQEQWDEAATKLDLAKAYIDMGDADGARSILEEVAVEGNEEQQQQAAALAAQIA